jgi:hypothetical protein|tara:strand:+ start:559 stop:708 length:150 start_codon:yes stop_codon:yes gene_type:complete
LWFFELFEEKSTPFGVLDNIVFDEEEIEEEEEVDVDDEDVARTSNDFCR